MKKPLSIGLASVLLAGAASADGLYYVGAEAKESMPLKWVVGLDVTYDDNVTPNSGGGDEESYSANAYVGLSVVSITPQTSWDVYARVGALYYFNDIEEQSDDLYPQARVGANVTHRFNERVRVSSRNFLAYELEPDYSYGFATSRQSDPYFYWQTDNSVGYRWSERFATYTGFILTGLDYDSDVQNSDRFTWTIYNQFRYQLSPQTVLTAEYRYADTEGDGLAEDSTDQYALLGVEHRFSPNSILIARVGAQFRDVDGGDGSTSPYAEIATSTRVNEVFTVRAFLRYGLESYDTVQAVGTGLYDFAEKETLRIGVSAEYSISPMFAIFGGVDYIPATYDEGSLASGVGPANVGGYDEDLVNAYVGLSVKFTDYLSGSLTYNFTDSSSDFDNRDYDRNRVTVGVRAEF